MPLAHLLYRCPLCGHDPTSGRGDRVDCPSCRAAFLRGPSDARIVVQEPGHPPRSVPTWDLTAAMDRRAGSERGGAGEGGDGGEAGVRPAGDAGGEWGVTAGGEVAGRGTETAGALRRARVTVRREVAEEPIRFRGRLLGFVERLGEGSEGELVLDAEGLRVALDDGTSRRWPLLELRSIQTSSSALQVRPRGEGITQFRFHDDSPRRWEDLLRNLLRRLYHREGLGEIVEFQPRIATR